MGTGGFTKTCKKYSLKGGNLFAECKNKKGKFIAGQINLGGCIANKNGKLTFGGKDFEKSSKGCSFKGTTLKCQTKNKKGKFTPSTLNIDKLISNNNGLLQCGKVKEKKLLLERKLKKEEKKERKEKVLMEKNIEKEVQKVKKKAKAHLGSFAKSCSDLKF